MKRRIVALFVLFLMVGCQSTNTDPSTNIFPQTAAEIEDGCNQPVDFGFNVENAAQTPADATISIEEGITLTKFGIAGAEEIAGQLTAGTSCCDFPISAFAEELISQALKTANDGDKQAAREILLNILSTAQDTSIHFIKYSQDSNRRQIIRDCLRVAEMDTLLGGDGQTYMDKAGQIFNDIANSELSTADLNETMDILEDAIRLGDLEIEEKCRERAEKIVKEGLEAALEDFDPCVAEKDDIRDLLNKLATAQLFAIPEAQEEGDVLYDQVNAEIRTALDRLFNEAAKQANRADLLIPIPDCELSGEIEVMIYKPWSEEIYISVGRIPFQVIGNEYPAEVQGTGKISFQGTDPLNECSIITNIDAAVDISGTFNMTGKAGLFDLELSFGPLPNYGTLDCPESAPVTLTLPSLTYPAQFPMVDNTTQEVSGIYHLVLHLSH